MTVEKEITIVRDSGHEWIGIYVDGELVDEGHSFSEEMILEGLGIKYKKKKMPDSWDDTLPLKLSDLK